MNQVGISHIINDCNLDLCVPTYPGEGLSSILKKICNSITTIENDIEEGGGSGGCCYTFENSSTIVFNKDGNIISAATINGFEDFDAGNLAPLFTTNVATSTTTPFLSFSLDKHPANTVFAGPLSGPNDYPSFRALDISDMPFDVGDFIQNQYLIDQSANWRITGHGKVGDYLQIADTARISDGTSRLKIVSASDPTIGADLSARRMYFQYDNTPNAFSTGYFRAGLSGANTLDAVSPFFNFYSDAVGIVTNISPIYPAISVGGTYPLKIVAVPETGVVAEYNTLELYKYNTSIFTVGTSQVDRNYISFASNIIGTVKKAFGRIGTEILDYGVSTYKADLVFETTDATINTGVPTEHMRLKYDGRVYITSLDTDNSPPTTSGVTKMVICDDNGLLSFATIPSGGAGSVTSVGLSMPSAFTVSASPITSSGTILVTGSGTTAQYVRGDGSLAATSSISTLYTADGTTTGARTVTLGSTLNFTGNNIGIDNASPTAKLHFVKNSVVTAGQTENNGILLQNNTVAATISTGQVSPPITFSVSSKPAFASASTTKFQLYAEGGGGLSTADGRLKLTASVGVGSPVTLYTIHTSGQIDENLNLFGHRVGAAGTGTSNFRAGFEALNFLNNSSVTGGFSTAVGYQAMRDTTTGAQNTAFGSNALQSNITGVDNTAVGMSALLNGTANDFNTAVGSFALSHATTGFANTAIGKNALCFNTTAIKNVAVGAGAMENTTTGGFNVALGEDAMLHNTTGINNIAIGWLAGALSAAGVGNISIGFNAGTNSTSGDSNIFIGYQAGTQGGQLVSATNSIAIGGGTVTTASNQTVIGNNSTVETRLRGRLVLPSYGVGTYAGAGVYNLVVDASGNILEGSAAGSQNFQSVLTAGSILTGNNTVDVNSHNFSWTNAVDYSIAATGNLTLTSTNANGTFFKIAGYSGASDGDVLTVVDHLTGQVGWATPGGAGGGVTSFSAGTLSPLFTTGVATATSTPALSFILTNAGANTWFGNNTGGSTSPAYNSTGTVTKADDTNVTLTLGGTPTNSVLNSFSITAGWTGNLAVSRGGTAITSYTAGDIIRATGSTTLTKLAIGTALQVLRVNAGATDLEWATPTVGTVTDFSAGDLSGFFTTSEATTTTTPALSFAIVNAAANTYWGNSTGSTTSPSYTAAGALTTSSDTNIVITVGGNAATSLLRSASITASWSGILSVARGGTNIASYSAGDILMATGATTLSKLAIGSPLQQLRVNAGGTALEYFTAGPGITTLNTLTAATQLFAVGASGTDFNISSVTDTHTFNIPTAGIGITRGLVTNVAQTFDGLKTFNVGVVINESGANSGASGDFRVESDTNANALFVDATNNRVGLFTALPSVPVHVTGHTEIDGSLAINTTPTTAAPLTIGGSGYTSGGIILFPSISAAVASSPSIIGITGTIIEAASGNHTIVAGLNITAPTITAGLATITNAASLYISGAPSATVSGGLYSILVNGGTSRFNGDIVQGTGTASVGAYDLIVRNQSSGRFETVDPDIVAINSQSGTTYTLVLTDKGKYIPLTNAAAITLTIPTNASVAFPIGTEITIKQGGAGQVTITPAGGVTLQGADSAFKTRVVHSAVTLIKESTNTWTVFGDTTT